MRRLVPICALGAVAAGIFVALQTGCIPYLEKPEPDAWTLSNLEGHLAVAFNGENDSSDVTYTFSNSASPAAGYDFGRVLFNFQLSGGTAMLEIRAGATLLVQTSGVPGSGPWARFDLALTDPGTTTITNLDVRIVTDNATGMISVNVDEVDPTAPGNRIGFTYSRSFPDDFGDPPAGSVIQEVYSWTPPVDTGTFQATREISGSVQTGWGPIDVDIRDNGDTQIEPHQISAASSPYQPGPALISGASGTVGPPDIQGYWKIIIDHTNPGGDAALNLKLSIP